MITSPERIEDEAEKITRLLKAGIDYVHIRKPGYTLREVRDLIEDIPYPLRRRLRLHGHFELLNDMNLGGVHLNHRNPEAPANAASITASCHTLREINESDRFDYVTLSPIFDSISKEGYCSRFNPDAISGEIRGKKVIALGGVRPESFNMLKQKGFYGAALLGYIWQGDFEERLSHLSEYLKTIDPSADAVNK